jgi:hypothetical protein
MMIIRPWPPAGTIMATDLALPDAKTWAYRAADPGQMVEALRTIATCVLGFTELLRHAEVSDGDRQTYLGMLNEQAARLARIVDQLDGACDASDALPKRPA